MTGPSSPVDFPPPRGACPFGIAPDYVRLQAQGPMAEVSMGPGRTAWLVTGYAANRALFQDSRLSADRTSPDYPSAVPAGGPGRSIERLRAGQSFNQMDGAEHHLHRRMVLPYFTVRRARALRPGLRAAAAELLDDVVANGPPTDLVSGLAAPFAARMLAQLYAVPDADRAFFSERLVRGATDRQTGGAALCEIGAYLATLLGRRRSDPGDDLVSAVAGHPRYDTAGGPERAVTVLMQTLVAGNESTLSMIAMGGLLLLTHHDQWEALHAEPGAVVGAVEELLRVLSVADTVPRFATTDVAVAGRILHPGDGVLLCTPAANRDAAVFADPDRFDITRRARHHLAFGSGVHQCVGQNVARTALQVVLRALAERIPTARLAVPADQVVIDGGVGVHRVTRLPVTW